MIALYGFGMYAFSSCEPKAFAEEPEAPAETSVETSVQSAEETHATNDEYDITETVTQAQETIAELKQQVAALIANIDRYKEDNFFKEFVLPPLISAGVLVILGIIAAAPFLKRYFKNKKELTQYISAYAAEKQKNKDYEQFSIESFVDFLKGFLSDEVKKQFDEFAKTIKMDETAFAKLLGYLETMGVRFDGVIEAAKVVWGPNKTALALLSAIPTQEAVTKAELKVKRLEDYVRQTKGDEAEDIIKEVENI